MEVSKETTEYVSLTDGKSGDHFSSDGGSAMIREFHKFVNDCQIQLATRQRELAEALQDEPNKLVWDVLANQCQNRINFLTTKLGDISKSMPHIIAGFRSLKESDDNLRKAIAGTVLPDEQPAEK